MLGGLPKTPSDEQGGAPVPLKMFLVIVALHDH